MSQESPIMTGHWTNELGLGKRRSLLEKVGLKGLSFVTSRCDLGPMKKGCGDENRLRDFTL